MKTILNKLRISTGFATLSADECAELVAHIEGGVVVSREFLQRIADTDWFNAPKGAAAEQSILARQMLAHHDRACHKEAA